MRRIPALAEFGSPVFRSKLIFMARLIWCLGDVTGDPARTLHLRRRLCGVRLRCCGVPCRIPRRSEPQGSTRHRLCRCHRPVCRAVFATSAWSGRFTMNALQPLFVIPAQAGIHFSSWASPSGFAAGSRINSGMTMLGKFAPHG